MQILLDTIRWYKLCIRCWSNDLCICHALHYVRFALSFSPFFFCHFCLFFFWPILAIFRYIFIERLQWRKGISTILWWHSFQWAVGRYSPRSDKTIHEKDHEELIRPPNQTFIVVVKSTLRSVTYKTYYNPDTKFKSVNAKRQSEA